MFERFYRVDKSHSKEVGGTGLGLSIVKHAAQYHGAKIELKSDPGKGTAIARQLHRCKITVNSDRAAAEAAASFVHFPDPA